MIPIDYSRSRSAISIIELNKLTKEFGFIAGFVRGDHTRNIFGGLGFVVSLYSNGRHVGDILAKRDEYKYQDVFYLADKTGLVLSGYPSLVSILAAAKTLNGI